MAFTENLSPFFNKGTGFAETATIGATSVDGIFDEPSADELEVGSTRPQFTCPTASLPVGYRTASIVIRGRTFKVAGKPDADETGAVTVLELTEQ